MKRDGRLSMVLHLLLHLARSGRPLTSEEMGGAAGTNPVVVRRTLAGLREAGWIRSVKGHGGGWTLACDLAAVTLADVHRALGEPSMLAVGHRSDDPRCMVERVVNGAIDASLREAEALVLARFGEVTLASLAAEIDRLAPHGHNHEEIDG